ncbi:MAG: arsenate reductase ArsC [Pseudohongiellaceae bacterium]|nr:arsenate reductase ArsC [Pseudohongiellaceae bacterium]
MLLDESSKKPFNVLVLCTGNSARSILAEALFNKSGDGLFHAFSAGSNPAGAVNPFALELLQQQGYDCSGFRSKSWDEFAATDAPKLDLVVTVCSNAAAETCPAFKGEFKQVHWGLPDPAEYTNEPERARKAFGEVYSTLKQRIEALVSLETEALNRDSLAEAMEALSH